MTMMTVWTACDDNTGGDDKCRLENSALTLTNVGDRSANATKINQYTGAENTCGAKLTVTANGPLPLSNAELNAAPGNNWMLAPNIIFAWGPNGFACPDGANVTLTRANVAELKIEKVGANPNGNHKFQISISDREWMREKFGNLGAFTVIGDNPNQPGIRESGDIIPVANKAAADAKSGDKVTVNIVFDTDVMTQAQADALEQLTHANITIAGEGKILPGAAGIVMTPELLNKAKFGAKGNLLFELTAGSNKYELTNRMAQVAVNDTLASGKDGAFLKHFVPKKGLHVTDDFDARSLKYAKDYPGTLDMVIENRDASQLKTGVLSMHTLQYVDDEVMEQHSTLGAPNSGNPWRAVGPDRKPTNPVYGVFTSMPNNERPISLQTGPLEGGVNITELTIEGCNNVAKLAASVRTAREDLLGRSMDTGGGVYPYYIKNVIPLKIPHKGNDFKNQSNVLNFTGTFFADPYTITYVCSRIIEQMNLAMGNGRNIFHVEHWPLPTNFKYGQSNHAKSDAKQLGVVLAPEHDERISSAIGDVHQDWAFLTEFEIVAGLIMENRRWWDQQFEGLLAKKRTIDWKRINELPTGQNWIGK